MAVQCHCRGNAPPPARAASLCEKTDGCQMWGAGLAGEGSRHYQGSAMTTDSTVSEDGGREGGREDHFTMLIK